jgi:CheY-like chemotaxis protein
MRILIIEDNKDNLELVRFLLLRSGHDVLAEVDGVSGLQTATQETPDLILLDLALPELDGWAAAKKLKENARTQSIPLVALTAHTLPGDKRRAMDAGCDGYIPKPINVATFPAEVENYFNAKLSSV